MTDLGSPDPPRPKSRFPKEMPGSPDTASCQLFLLPDTREFTQLGEKANIYRDALSQELEQVSGMNTPKS